MSLMLFKSIIVASNDIFNRIWIAIGIDKAHDRNAELVGFGNANALCLDRRR